MVVSVIYGDYLLVFGDNESLAALRPVRRTVPPLADAAAIVVGKNEGVTSTGEPHLSLL